MLYNLIIEKLLKSKKKKPKKFPNQPNKNQQINKKEKAKTKQDKMHWKITTTKKKKMKWDCMDK